MCVHFRINFNVPLNRKKMMDDLSDTEFADCVHLNCFGKISSNLKD